MLMVSYQLPASEWNVGVSVPRRLSRMPETLDVFVEVQKGQGWRLSDGNGAGVI